MKLFFIVILFCPILLTAQNLNTSKLDSLFRLLDENQKFMGSVQLSKDGNTLYQKTIGYSNVAQKQKATENSLYRIGSITKTFTAVLIFKAIEKKKLTLDQPIVKWFPNLKNAEKITVSHLLQHRSGIYNFTQQEDYLDWEGQAKSRAGMLALINSFEPVFEPNEKSSYSNSNYILLTLILEKVFKKDYPKLVQKYIAKPLCLKNTSVSTSTNLLPSEVYSYQYVGDWELDAPTHMSIPLGAGAIVSTASDLTKFLEGIYKGKVIKKESLEKMTAIRDGYGRGLFEFPYNNRRGYGHTGGIDGFSSVLTHFPSENITIALTSNGTNYDNNEILLALLNSYFQQPFDLPTFYDYESTPEELNQYEGIYYNKTSGLEIAVSRKNITLIAQATGQSAFPLQQTGEHVFVFDKAGVLMKFVPQKDYFILQQNGQTLVFAKKE